MTSAELRVLDDPAAEVARLLCEAAEAGGDVVLTGGSTPGKAYEMAVDRGADWSRATVWFGDERCVDPDDEVSNYRLAHETLLSRITSAPDVQRMQGELGPEEGARAYERAVRERLGERPAWDLLLLGLGPDGHCASLFPNRPEKDVDDRLVVGVPEAGLEPWVPRISLTLPALDAARHVVFLITGEKKSDAVRRAFVERDQELPSARLRPAGTLTVLLDPAAAP